MWTHEDTVTEADRLDVSRPMRPGQGRTARRMWIRYARPPAVAATFLLAACATVYLAQYMPILQSAGIAFAGAAFAYFALAMLIRGVTPARLTPAVFGLILAVVFAASPVPPDPRSVTIARLELIDREQLAVRVVAGIQTRPALATVDIATRVTTSNVSERDFDATLATSRLVLLTSESRTGEPNRNAPEQLRVGGLLGPTVWVRTFRQSEAFCDSTDPAIKHVSQWEGHTLAPGETLVPGAADIALYRHWPTPETIEQNGYDMSRMGLLGVGWLTEDDELVGFAAVTEWDDATFDAMVDSAPSAPSSPEEAAACAGSA